MRRRSSDLNPLPPRADQLGRVPMTVTTDNAPATEHWPTCPTPRPADGSNVLTIRPRRSRASVSASTDGPTVRWSTRPSRSWLSTDQVLPHDAPPAPGPDDDAL